MTAKETIQRAEREMISRTSILVKAPQSESLGF